MQAEEQVRLAKERKKGDKIVSDSQERAYWRVYRPPPGYSSCLESVPIPHRNRGTWQKKKTVEDLRRDVSFISFIDVFIYLFPVSPVGWICHVSWAIFEKFEDVVGEVKVAVETGPKKVGDFYVTRA